MNIKNRFSASLALAAALALPILTNGCSSDSPLSQNGLCCTDFKIGADLSGVDFGVDASIKGQFTAFAQASADLSATATGALGDVTSACRAIAQAGGANTDKDDEAATKSEQDRVGFWCDLAVARITATVKASGSLKIDVQAPQCEASVSASAKCSANCNVSGGCDVKAKPPTCEGGKMEISCSGGCTAEAGASVTCEGGCTGTCEGSCSAEGGVSVDCEGKCEGTCEAGGSANGSGVQADGSCKGKCNGTCTASATAPKVECKGTCKGSCSAKCEAKAGASVKCDGKCDAKAEPISCKGGTLKASCDVDAKCDANCNASAQAKAECTPPRVDIVFTGNATAEVNAVIDALKFNLPNIFLVVKARGQAFVDLTATVAGNADAVFEPGNLSVKGAACLGAIVPAIVKAGTDMGATFKAAGKVSASVGG
ncbi:keratin associated protein [Labilithrix luteola]|uniref:Keratin associated protein n=1 Tax=Labilithrix luteola TaxID=1391654 RepID=A0A0K1PLE2_9BACT|nr:hypothetical protein [Labilithrix luteola]AKU94342.1 keratin associated protein [Labilithrix luteola]